MQQWVFLLICLVGVITISAWQHKVFKETFKSDTNRGNRSNRGDRGDRDRGNRGDRGDRRNNRDRHDRNDNNWRRDNKWDRHDNDWDRDWNRDWNRRNDNDHWWSNWGWGNRTSNWSPGWWWPWYYGYDYNTFPYTSCDQYAQTKCAATVPYQPCFDNYYNDCVNGSIVA